RKRVEPVSGGCRRRSVRPRLELAAVALELLVLRGDDVGRRALAEALVRELLLAACDLVPQPLALAGGVAVAGDGGAIWPHDGLEDALLLALEPRSNARAAEDRRGVLHALERAGLRLVTGLRPRRHDQPRLPRREV